MKQRTKQECLNTVEKVREVAQEKFWEAVAEAFPEIDHGDFTPLQSMILDKACEVAIERWIENNYPE